MANSCSSADSNSKLRAPEKTELVSTARDSTNLNVVVT